MVSRLVKSVQSNFNSLPDIKCVDADYWLNKYPPIFIVGPPRSGTTLVYQSLISALDLSFITNIMALFPRYMVSLAKLGTSYRNNGFASSNYGYIPGMLAPNEAGPIMAKWFSSGDDCPEERVRCVVASLAKNRGGCFVNKSGFNVFRIEKIA